MIDRLSIWLETLHRYPGTVLAATAVCVPLACAGLRGIRFDSTLTGFFPPGSEVARTLAFLSDASLSDKVAVSFGRDTEIPESAFLDASDAFAERAATLPGIRNVLASADASGWQTGLSRFYALMPQWLTPDELEALKPRLEPTAVRAALKHRYGQLARPEGAFLVNAIRHDPLGFFDASFAALGNGASRLGYDVSPDGGGRLMSRDSLHRLLLLDVADPVTDVRAAERLLKDIDAALDGLPPGVRADVVCGHAHSVSNQMTVQRDLSTAGSVSMVALGALLLFFYRDARVVLTVLVAMFAVLVALPVCARVFGSVTFLTGAFGPVVAGLTVDYGIHVCRSGGRIRALLPPILAGMGTTFAVFAGFFASSAEGYRQIGCFGAVAVAAAFIFSICVLPVLTRWGGSARSLPEPQKPPFRLPAGVRAGLAIVFVCVVCAGLTRLRLDNDFSRMDGSEQSVFDAEKRFQDIWGTKDGAQAILAVKVAEGEDADETGAWLYSEAGALLGKEAVSGFAALAPTPRQRAARLDAWRAFWAEGGRVARLRETLLAEGAAFGFAEDAFEPFLSMLATPGTDTGLDSLGALMTLLRERFVLPARSGGAYAAVYVPDDEETFARLEPWLAAKPEVTLISRNGIPGAFARAFCADISRIAAAMGALLLAVVWMVLGSLRRVVRAMLPCIAATGAVFGGLGLAGIPINIAHMLAGMVVLGVTFDYGVFFLYESLGLLETRLRGDVRLCLLTTLAGAAPMLLAGHPVIFSLGLTLTAGVSVGYLMAAGVVFPPRGCAVGLLAVLLVGGMGGGCATALPRGNPVCLTDTQRAELRAFPDQPYEMTQGVTITLRGRDFPGFGLTRITPRDEHFAASCMTSQGMTIFEIAGQRDSLDVCRVIAGAGRPEEAGAAFARDIRNVYFGNLPAPDAVWQEDGAFWTAISKLPDGETVTHRFERSGGRLAEKRCVTRKGRLAWSATFSDYDTTGPRLIEMHNRTLRWPYTLTIRVKTWQKEKEPCDDVER